MTVEPMTMYRIVCDAPDCTTSTNELTYGETIAWADADQAVEHWLGCDGTTDRAGHHYCLDHRDGMTT